MIIVPVAGDTLETVDDLPFKVVAYTNYKQAGAAVMASPASGGETVPIYFNTIAEINDKPVTLLTNNDGYKVFGTEGYVKRDYQLPQPGSFLESDVSGVETRKYKVKRLRVHVPNLLSSGMIIDCEDTETNEEVQIGLKQITGIDQTLFKQSGFQSYYADYLAKGAA